MEKNGNEEGEFWEAIERRMRNGDSFDEKTLKEAAVEYSGGSEVVMK